MLEVPKLTDDATVAAIRLRVGENFEFTVKPERDPPVWVGPSNDVRGHRVMESSDERRALRGINGAAAQDVLRVLAFRCRAARAVAEFPGETQVAAADDHGGDLLRAPLVHGQPVGDGVLVAVLTELAATFEPGIVRVENMV